MFAAIDHQKQVDCELDRLAKFRKAGIELVDGYDQDGNEFYIVNGRTCHHYRTKAWSDGFPRSKLIEQVNRETACRVAILVMVEEGSSHEDLDRTITSLVRQSSPPFMVTFVVYSDDQKPNKLHPHIGREIAKRAREAKGLGGKMIGVATPFSWSVQTVFERLDGGRPVPRGRAVDITVGKLQAHYYTVFASGFEIPEDFVKGVIHAFDEELRQFTALLPYDESGNGLTVFLPFHKHPSVGGNRPIKFVGEQEKLISGVDEKAVILAEGEGRPGMVGRVSDVCPL